jgi:hypothetical protein
MQVHTRLLHLRYLNNERTVHRVVDSVMCETFSKRLEERLVKSIYEEKLKTVY